MSKRELIDIAGGPHPRPQPIGANMTVTEEMVERAAKVHAPFAFEATHTSPFWAMARDEARRDVRAILEAALAIDGDTDAEQVEDCNRRIAELLRGRDALRKALEPFASFGRGEDGKDIRDGLMRDRICDWFGPSDFDAARAAAPPPTDGKT